MKPSSTAADIQPHLDPIALALDRSMFAGFCLTLVGAAVSISVASIGSVTYAVALAAGAARDRSRLPAFPFWQLAVLFAAVVFASAAINGFPAESWQGTLKYAWGFLLLYAAVDVVHGKRRWFAVAAVIMVCEGVAALSGIGQDYIGRDFLLGRLPVPFTEYITRITGPFKHCNDFATFLIAGWLFGCSWTIERLRRKKLWTAVAGAVFLALIGWAMWRTMSRGAMIGAGAGMVVLAFTLPYRRWILGAMAFGTAAIYFVPSIMSERLHELAVLEGGLHERLFLIQGTLKMIADSPWFGLGPNTYTKWFPVFNPPDPAYPVLMYAHNSYLQMAAEIGWLGLAGYLTIIVCVLVFAATRLREPSSDRIQWIRAAALAAAVGLLVNALFESLLQSTQLRSLFWCLLGLAAARLTSSKR